MGVLHYHYLNSLRGGNNIILSRFRHRRALYPLGFSGDTVVSWETLDYLPYLPPAKQYQLHVNGHDIGGHIRLLKTTKLT